jgi:GNAT superfamily N-acetyltransferase
MNWYKRANLSLELSRILDEIRSLYNGIDLSVWEDDQRIELEIIEVPRDMRGQGIGSAVIRRLQDYALSVDKPIVLRPSPERGKKEALDRFYKGLGFVNNRGRHMDYELSSPMARTMYWKSRRK